MKQRRDSPLLNCLFRRINLLEFLNTDKIIYYLLRIPTALCFHLSGGTEAPAALVIESFKFLEENATERGSAGEDAAI
jgi:hypothetical protein